MKKIILILAIFYNIHLLAMGAHACMNKEHNVIEFVSDIEIINQKTTNDASHCCNVFTPLAPYNNVSCIVTAPKRVLVGQSFVIDFCLIVRSSTYLSFWADLMPSQEHMISQGLRLMSYNMPDLGVFDEYAESVAHKGGRGTWYFNQGIPAGTYHMSFTYMAQNAGVKSFATLLATNPPSYVKIMDIVTVDEAPYAQNDFVKAYSNEPLVIPVLDSDFGHSPLKIKSVSKPKHGSVAVNPDNTLTYISMDTFVGKDCFEYMIVDLADNEAKATVDIEVCMRPVAQIAE